MTEILQELNWETLAIRRKATRPPSFSLYKGSHNLTDILVVFYLQRNNDLNKKARGDNAFKFIVPRAIKTF